jgi:mannose-6-phosphate isomerase-like protein (cupin superfamily)
MKKISLLFFPISLVTLCFSTLFVINSSVYEWDKLAMKKTQTGEERTILSGPTQTLEKFDIKAITLNSGQSLKEYKVEKGFDQLLIIKEGSAEITVNTDVKTLGEGSIVVASQGDLVKIKNLQTKNTTFYVFLFKPKIITGIIRPELKVSPVLKDWNTIEFKTNDNGGRRDIIKQPTSTLKELEMHTTQLNEGISSHAAHNHPDEEIILMRFGIAEMTINGKPFKAGPGSVFFLSNMDNHGLRNVGKGKCEYYAIRWLTYTETKK